MKMFGDLGMLSSIFTATTAANKDPSKLQTHSPFAIMNYQATVNQQQQLYNESLAKLVSNYKTNEYMQRLINSQNYAYASLLQTQNARYHPYARPSLPADMSSTGSTMPSSDLNSPTRCRSPSRLSPAPFNKQK